MKLFAFFLLICSLHLRSQNLVPDTTWIKDNLAIRRVITPRHPYHQTLTLKLFLSAAPFDGKYKRKDIGTTDIKLTIEQAFEVIKKIDNLTLGIPKIIYLVGWQYNGHDSKYPAWFEGNPALKRTQDASTFQSIRWLMKEASLYHTTVSLHLNMMDAYKDSPLWDTYVNNNIIARNKDGSLREGEWGWPISYAQEWKTGYAQKRIDSICKLLPLQNAGTVHIDAFHSWVPLQEKGPISPYLNFTVQDETEAQRNIFKYWATKGIDVTSEGVHFLRETAFAGYQPMAWWFDGSLENYSKWPANFYCGGVDASKWGKLFGTSMHGEDIVSKDASTLAGFLKNFCLQTIAWYYLNRLDRLYYIKNDSIEQVHFSGNVITSLSSKNFEIKKNDTILLQGEDVLIPALWINKLSLVAYSANGYKARSWLLPAAFKKFKKLNVYSITLEGLKKIKDVNVQNNRVTLTLVNDQGILLQPSQ